MGLYFGKVRATGSSIRGFEGAAGGVIRWIKLVNDTAVAVDQPVSYTHLDVYKRQEYSHPYTGSDNAICSLCIS